MGKSKKTLANELKKSEELYKSIVELSPDAIAIHSEGKIVFVNPAAIQLLGAKEASELVGMPVSKIVHPDSAKIVGERIKQMLHEGTKAKPLEEKFVRLDGTPIDVEVSAMPLLYQEKPSIQVVIRDIRERKELDEMKNNFLNVVTHELKTPIATIKEALSQIADGLYGEIDGTYKRTIEISINNINRLNRLINNLLSISMINAGKIKVHNEHVDAIETANEQIELLCKIAEPKGLKIKKAFQRDKIELVSDKDKLVEIFTNLISNAIKYTDSGFIEVSIEEEESVVECCVLDTGRGISAENLKHVFGKFEQFERARSAGEKGFGLGLAITKGMVSALGGEIRIESEIGRGTKVCFSLPKKKG